MKLLTAVALVALLGLASSQAITGARQCVECMYWGGNWCPTANYTAAPSTSAGSCRLDTTCTTSLV
jgi:hypothetical protein